MILLLGVLASYQVVLRPQRTGETDLSRQDFDSICEVSGGLMGLKPNKLDPLYFGNPGQTITIQFLQAIQAQSTALKAVISSKQGVVGSNPTWGTISSFRA